MQNSSDTDVNNIAEAIRRYLNENPDAAALLRRYQAIGFLGIKRQVSRYKRR